MSANHLLIKNDPRWKQARSDCLDRDDHRCVRCQETEGLQVDHIVPLDDDLALAFELSNLQTLCPECHAEKGREDDDGESELQRLPWVHPGYADLLGDLIHTPFETPPSRVGDQHDDGGEAIRI